MISEMFRFQALQDHICTNVGLLRSTTMQILLDDTITLVDKFHLLKRVETYLTEELDYVRTSKERVMQQIKRGEPNE